MKTIGIIGGMGPLATSDIFRRIILLTDAKCDQEHIHVLIDDNTQIPDRTAAILAGGRDPVEEIVKSAKCLETAGADFLIMPCNTAHFFYERITAKINIPMLNMVEETAQEAERLGLSRVGILATDGTLKTKLYEDALAKRGIRSVHPTEEGQARVMDLIYNGVKAGNPMYDVSGFYEVMSEMEGGEKLTFLLACTEIPLAFSTYDIRKPFLDPTVVLAAKAVSFAGGRTVDTNLLSNNR